jgi:Fe-S cluster assembly protein SufD
MTSEALKIDNLPTPKEERWKYTNLPRALPANLVLADAPQHVVIHKNSGEVCEQLEDILFTGAEGAHQQPTLKITLERGAQMTLVERHEGEGAYWKNMTTEITLEEGAILKHIRIQNDDARAVNTNMVHITAARDSVYDGFAMNTGGKLTRHEITASLDGTNAEVSFNGINLLNEKQVGDTTILINHMAPHCRSNQFYRTILDDSAKGVFQGKVYVDQIAQKTDGYQLANTLLLSDKAEMDTKPELEIYADDVKCSHGSTCGQLDEEPLFYLRQRGLTEAQARMLLIQAFVDEVVDKIGDEGLKAELLQGTDQWLSAALQK